MTDIDEYRVKVTIRNNLLLTAIEQAGYSSQAEFARDAGLSATDVNILVGLRKAPIGTTGEFSAAAKAIMECLGAAPSDLWTDDQLLMELDRNSGERSISAACAQFLMDNHIQSMTLPNPEDSAIEKDRRRIVDGVLDTLTTRERKVVELRTTGDLSYEDIGKAFDVTGERARQIEAKAYRKMRDPKHKKAFGSIV